METYLYVAATFILLIIGIRIFVNFKLEKPKEHTEALAIFALLAIALLIILTKLYLTFNPQP